MSSTRSLSSLLGMSWGMSALAGEELDYVATQAGIFCAGVMGEFKTSKAMLNSHDGGYQIWYYS